jgi:hypothetical protein
MSKWKLWWHKLTHYEYWPFDLFYLPIYPYFVFLALKHRSFFFFTASNPSIEFGGMLGEKKSEIYKLIPEGRYPATVLCSPDISGKEVLEILRKKEISFPFIVKPNIGERGKGVEKIDNLPSLYKYLSTTKVDFLIQSYVDLPEELGLFYVKIPGDSSGKITSLTSKDFLTVTGDGESSIEELLYQNMRARLTFNFESRDFRDIKACIPDEGEIVNIEPIGNHSRGTGFINRSQEVTASLLTEIEKVVNQIDGFYFGRLDLRCNSIRSIAEGGEWSIIEINGAGAEPGHIYQPGYGIFNAYKDIIMHLNLLSTVSMTNKHNGQNYWSFKQGIAKMREIRTYNQRFA